MMRSFRMGGRTLMDGTRTDMTLQWTRPAGRRVVCWNYSTSLFGLQYVVTYDQMFGDISYDCSWRAFEDKYWDKLTLCVTIRPKIKVILYYNYINLGQIMSAWYCENVSHLNSSITVVVKIVLLICWLNEDYEDNDYFSDYLVFVK